MNLPLFPPPTVHNKFDPAATIVLYQGDTSAFLPSIPDNSVHLIITSPPYNLGKAYEARQSLKAYLQEQASVIHQLVRVLHPQGSLCWQG